MKHLPLLQRVVPLAVTLTLTSLIGACASRTSYRPSETLANRVMHLPSAQKTDAVQFNAPPVLWWKELGDEQLASLVQLAWTNNHDVRVAAARLNSAREQLRATHATRLPDAQFSLSAGRTGLAEAERRSGAGTVIDPVAWHGLLSWELDLFGRIQHGIDAAQASAEEQSALHDDIRRLILAQLVEAYLDLRGTQTLRGSLQAQLDNQSTTLALLRERERFGTAPRVDRLRFEAQFRLSAARLPALLARERAARNRLATLSGQALGAPALNALDQPGSLNVPDMLVVDAPANLLRRRPDVRAAEQALAGAVAREGVAFSDLFPRISIAALIGGLGPAGNWTGADARRWNAGAAFALPLFDGGARRARLRAASDDIEGARAAFDKVMATALEETDTAISSWVRIRQRQLELDHAHALAQESASLARARFQEGADSLLAVLEAERTALSAREQLVGARRDLAIAAARSYTAMAGGLDMAGQGK